MYTSSVATLGIRIDGVIGDEDTPVTYSVLDLVGNDTDVDSSTLTIATTRMAVYQRS